MTPSLTGADKIVRWDHVAIAMRSIEQGIPFFRDVLGGVFIKGGDDLLLRTRTLMFKLPVAVKVELMQPLDEHSYLHRHIERRGEGFHHATIFVPDVEATIAELTATGFETVDTDLRLSSWSETFVRPKSGFGCLFQIVSSDLDWLTPHPTATVEQVLAGEWRWWQTNIWHVSDLPSDYPTEFPHTDRPTPAR